MTEQPTDATLLPCPFCAGFAAVSEVFPISETPWFVSVSHADDCELRTADDSRLTHVTREEAVASWNTRTMQAASPTPNGEGELYSGYLHMDEEHTRLPQVGDGVEALIEKVARAIEDDRSKRHYGIPGDWDGLPEYQQGERRFAAIAALEAVRAGDGR